ncbi:MAG: hypothetical protein RIR51_393 [Bacteroidota bacterium]|jgi:NADH-quinone oxidoreductase subunit C
MDNSLIIDLIKKEISIEVNFNEQNQLVLEAENLFDVMELLWKHESTYFDQLSCLTGIDLGEEKGKIQLIYTLNSIPHNFLLNILVEIPRMEKNKLPQVPSLVKIWKTADWHEREVYDLVGVNFKGHPDLRRILLPEDWEGHPLRKDYQEQEKYHGIKVKY